MTYMFALDQMTGMAATHNIPVGRSVVFSH